MSTRRIFSNVLFLALAFPLSAKGQGYTTLAFGDVSTSSGAEKCTNQFQVYTGSSSLNLTSVTSPSGFSVPYETNPVYPNNYVTICILFAPSTMGAYSGTVDVTYNNNITYQVAVSGNGVVSGFVNPKYVVLGVMYAPPGSQSNATYGSDTVVGNSTSITTSFSDLVTKSVSISNGGAIPGFTTTRTSTNSNSYTQEQDTSLTIDMSQTTSNSTSLNGFSDPNKGINHDWDYIFVWLNPIATFAIGPNSNQVTWTGYGWDENDPTRPDMDVLGVPAGCLNADFKTTNPAEWSTCQSYFSGPLARTWAKNNVDGSGPGLTSADFTNILAVDPFSNPNYTFTPPPAGSDTTADGRFTACNNTHCNQTIDYEPNLTFSYLQGYSTTVTQSQTTKYTYSQTYSVEDQFKGTSFLSGFEADLKNSTTLTWTNEFKQSTNNSNGQTSSFKIVGPPSGYTGPAQFVVYQDNLYGTFMFNPQ